jgi:soluble lytic murein transglycosylase
VFGIGTDVTWRGGTAAPWRRRARRSCAASAAVAGLLAVVLLAVAGAAADTPRPSQPPVRTVLAQTFGAIDAGDYDAARALTARLDDPLLAKTLTWFRLTARRTGGQYGDYTAFLADNPDWPGRATLRHRAEGLMPADLSDAAVRLYFADQPPVSAYGAERYADALAAAGQQAEAQALLRNTWLTRHFPAADEQRFAQRYADVLSPDLHRARLDRLLWDGRHTAAAKQAERVDPGHRALARARLRLARMEPGVDAAIAAVPAELRGHPGLIYERARWRQRKDRHEDVVALLDPPIADAPNAANWWRMRHRAARKALDRGDISVAYRIAAHHGLTAGLGFAEGEWLAGWIALRWLREPATALPHFTRLYDGVTTPVSRARGAYWAGRAAEAAGAREDARVWYETAARNLTTYYGQLAAARLSADFFLALPLAPQPSNIAARAFAADELVRAVKALGRHGHAARIDPLFDALVDRATTRERAQLTADLAAHLGRADLAVRTARQVRRAGIILPNHLYPEVRLPAPAQLVPGTQALVLAIVRQESGFDPTAVSRAGARGMMQLMPATARHVARSLDLDPARHSLDDPEFNLLLGSTYMEGLVRRYDGSLLLAVAAYNAGPGRVSGWLKRYGDPRADHIDPVDWVETLPFAETRNYIQRVFEGLTIYRHRLAPKQVAIALDARLRAAADPGPTGRITEF